MVRTPACNSRGASRKRYTISGKIVKFDTSGQTWTGLPSVDVHLYVDGVKKQTVQHNMGTGTFSFAPIELEYVNSVVIGTDVQTLAFGNGSAIITDFSNTVIDDVKLVMNPNAPATYPWVYPLLQSDWGKYTVRIQEVLDTQGFAYLFGVVSSGSAVGMTAAGGFGTTVEAQDAVESTWWPILQMQGQNSMLSYVATHLSQQMAMNIADTLSGAGVATANVYYDSRFDA